jgi:hypothetical protein
MASPLHDSERQTARHPARARSASSPVAQNHAIVAGTASSAADDEAQHASPQTFYATDTGINAAVIPGRIAPH